MTPKEIVAAFYNSDVANDKDIVSKFFHKDCEMHWNSSRGFTLLNYNQLEEFFKDSRAAFNSLRFDHTHLFESGNMVTSRHHLFAETIEQPDEEDLIAHFISIWEVKDGKIYRCYELSQQADHNTINA